jgi:hypothetical protein
MSMGGLPALPEPVLPTMRRPYGILVTGVGGTGVVTIGGLLGMAAHLENKGVTVLDMAGLAQKGGAVLSHVQIAAKPDDLHATRIAMGEADLVIGCDAIVSATDEVISKTQTGRTRAVVNTRKPRPPRSSRTRSGSSRACRPSRTSAMRSASLRLHQRQRAGRGAAGRRDLHEPAGAGLRVAEGLDSADARSAGARSN